MSNFDQVDIQLAVFGSTLPVSMANPAIFQKKLAGKKAIQSLLTASNLGSLMLDACTFWFSSFLCKIKK